MIKKLAVLLFIILNHQFLFGQEDVVTCTIEVENNVLAVGETPEIRISFKNNGDNDIYLIKSLDASAEKWRYPYVYYTIEKLGDSDYKVKNYMRCGNMDGISETDFVRVSAGDNFSPMDIDHYYFFDHRVKNKENFKEPGKYKIIFHYSTLANDLSDYMGMDMDLMIYETVTTEGDENNPPQLLKKVKKNYSETIEVLEQLFEQVPKIEIQSNAVIIEVK